MDAIDLKEQVIAWWIDVINHPEEHTWTKDSPGVCPSVFLTIEHNDGCGAPLWKSERAFCKVVMKQS